MSGSLFLRHPDRHGCVESRDPSRPRCWAAASRSLLEGAAMKVKPVSVLGGLALAVASLAAAPTPVSASAPRAAAAPRVGAARPWMNTGLSPEQRARLLVAQMTLDEKIAMVHGAGYPLPLN